METNTVLFSRKAENELQISYDWYEEQKSGLGELFLSVIEHSVSSIANHPKFYPVKTGAFRQYVLTKFPYVIVYEFLPKKNLIYILHVFNAHQNPKKKETLLNYQQPKE